MTADRGPSQSSKSGRAPSPEKEPSYLIPRVAHLATLEKDWDSYGAEAPSEKALRVVDQMSISPTATGWVEVEIDAENMTVTVWVDAEGRITETGVEWKTPPVSAPASAPSDKGSSEVGADA